MSKLTDMYATVENQLQWGPALDPIFREIIAEIDALNQKSGIAQTQKQVQSLPTVDSQARQSLLDAKNEIVSLKEKVTSLMESHDQLQSALHALSSPAEDQTEQTQETDPATSSTAATVQTAIDLPAST